MTKSILKEIIIILLLLIAIILVLGILFYDYIPTNKTIPSVETYSTAESIQTELQEQLVEEQTVLVTYEITSNDLKNYEKKGDYEKGKANPFSTYVTTPAGENNEDNGTDEESEDINANVNSVKGGTFYKDTGTK